MLLWMNKSSLKSKYINTMWITSPWFPWHNLSKFIEESKCQVVIWSPNIEESLSQIILKHTKWNRKVNNHRKQAGAELCQAQVKLGWQSNWVIGSLSFVFNYGYDLQKVATHLFIHGWWVLWLAHWYWNSNKASLAHQSFSWEVELS